MNVIQFDGKLTDQLERELIRREMSLRSLRPARLAPACGARDKGWDSRYAKALLAFKGALIVSSVMFVTVTLALQAAARFS